LVQLVVGRPVKFRVDHRAGPTGRNYATVWLAVPQPSADGAAPVLGVADGVRSLNFARECLVSFIRLPRTHSSL